MLVSTCKRKQKGIMFDYKALNEMPLEEVRKMKTEFSESLGDLDRYIQGREGEVTFYASVNPATPLPHPFVHRESGR